jgi:hypothetical protein
MQADGGQKIAAGLESGDLLKSIPLLRCPRESRGPPKPHAARLDPFRGDDENGS